MRREEFLKKHWRRYPSAPPHSVCGVLELVNRRHEPWIFRVQNQDHSVIPQSQDFDDAAFCCEGDLVAVEKRGENSRVHLLVPQVGKFSELSLRKWNLQFLWSLFLQSTRDYFQKQDFLEVFTPSLVKCPGSEPSLEVFATELHLGSRRQKLFLSTSPELAIKKFLAQASRVVQKPRVFEITKSFRNGEITSRHQPEFFILEWYRAYGSLDEIKIDIVNLISHLKRDLKRKISERTELASWMEVDQMRCDESSEKVSQKSFAELFLSHLHFRLTPQTTAEEMKNLALQLGLQSRNLESFDDLFLWIFSEKIENHWPDEELFFLEKYPPSQAALARWDSEGWAERFEFYWRGFEIANAFHELNDPELQRIRFCEDLDEKKRSGRQEVPEDLEFYEALDFGMPPSSGVALGLERLFMALFNLKDIQDLKLFPFSLN